jgi:hypothetical protein
MNRDGKWVGWCIDVEETRRTEDNEEEEEKQYARKNETNVLGRDYDLMTKG